MEHASVEAESTETLIARLQAEHETLERQIERIEAQHSWSVADETEIRRLKKLKLHAKDEIEQLRKSA